MRCSSFLKRINKNSSTKSRTPLLLLILFLVAVTLPFVSRAALQNRRSNVSHQKQKQLNYVPGEVLVRFRAGAKGAQAESNEQTLLVNGREINVQMERIDSSNIVEGLRLARVPSDETIGAIAALQSRADVLYAEPNYIRHLDTLPNDARFGEMWGLKNTGQLGGKAGADIHAEEAWSTTTGDRSIVVGVIDEGMDINHTDLQANIWRNTAEIAGNGIDDDGDGFVDDVNGWDFFHNDSTVFDGPSADNSTDEHGTHVAGTIGAVGNNGTGVVGVNWQVNLMSLKVFGTDSERPSSVSQFVQAYSYAKMMRDLWVSTNGAKGANLRVLNNSYGGFGHSQAEQDAISALGNSGILFVAAAGNDSESNDIYPHYPSSYDLPNILAVAASNRSDNLASFSNYGARTVHMFAPGAQILSTTPGNTYSVFDGTSMATPHVTGAAALVCARYPNISMQQLRAVLMMNGDVLANTTGLTESDRRLNVAASLQAAGEGDTTTPALTDFHAIAQDGRTVTLAWTAPGDDGASGRASLYEIRFTDQATNVSYLLKAMQPKAAGAQESVIVNVPVRHTAGTITLRAIDNAGNVGSSSINVTVNADAAEPYTVTESAPSQLSTGGNHLQMSYDDNIRGYILPF
ncbi:MAG: hypothetical protein AUG51_14790 [Acidobacteria bacterium 13_1_20CM_3_53_8]|nr:MAG: hypothetical protein AUG51_14790 [Acidobacteria bacterium 13_1_20CM_3_53_8]